ncbi:MAG TPA: ester cyclase [Vicinamibacterales bacterium]|nr:ester cyclase [Vicinamibacterales bacterium]
MDRTDLERLTDRYLTAMNRHDPRTLAALYAPDCRVDSPLFSSLLGIAAIEESYKQWFTIFPDIEFTPESTIVDPPRVAVTTVNTATHEGELFGLPATHKKVEFRSVRIVTVNEAGLIVAERRIYDFTGLLVQLGVLRAKPAKPSNG